jgi:hypothetical protein
MRLIMCLLGVALGLTCSLVLTFVGGIVGGAGHGFVLIYDVGLFPFGWGVAYGGTLGALALGASGRSGGRILMALVICQYLALALYGTFGRYAADTFQASFKIFPWHMLSGLALFLLSHLALWIRIRSLVTTVRTSRANQCTRGANEK